MPKLKTNRGAAKRFKMTKSGKIKFQKTKKRHLLECKTSKMKRKATNAGIIKKCDEKAIKQMMPYA